MQRQTIRTAAVTVTVLVSVAVIGGLAVMYSGIYNVAATAEHTGVMRWALSTVQQRSVAARAPDVPPTGAVNEDELLHAFEHFHEMCVVCHGAPGIDRGEFGQG